MRANLKNADRGFFYLRVWLEKTKFDKKGCIDMVDSDYTRKGW